MPILQKNAYLSQQLCQVLSCCFVIFPRRATTTVRSFSCWRPRALPPRRNEAPRRQEARQALHSWHFTAPDSTNFKSSSGVSQKQPLKLSRETAPKTHTQWVEEKKSSAKPNFRMWNFKLYLPSKKLTRLTICLLWNFRLNFCRPPKSCQHAQILRRRRTKTCQTKLLMCNFRPNFCKKKTFFSFCSFFPFFLNMLFFNFKIATYTRHARLASSVESKSFYFCSHPCPHKIKFTKLYITHGNF